MQKRISDLRRRQDVKNLNLPKDMGFTREESVIETNRLWGTFFKGAGSRNINKVLSKRRFCSIFDRLSHSDFPLLFSK